MSDDERDYRPMIRALAALPYYREKAAAERDRLWALIEEYASADEQLGYACALNDFDGLPAIDLQVTSTRAALRVALGFDDQAETP